MPPPLTPRIVLFDPTTPAALEGQTCSRKHCRKHVEVGSRYKMCTSCRQRNKAHQQRNRQRNKGSSQPSSRSSSPVQPPAKRRRSAASLERNSDDTSTLPPAPSSSPLIGDVHCIDDGYLSGLSDTLAEGIPANTASIKYNCAEELYAALRTAFKANDVSFNGSYLMEFDPLVSHRERAGMVNQEVKQVTGYRFTVRDHKKLVNGYRIRFWCCQDQKRRKRSKPSQKPDVKHREHVGMHRFPCASALNVTSSHLADENYCRITVKLEHHHRHTPYFDVDMPLGAVDMIREQLDAVTPALLVERVRKVYPHVTAQQIYVKWARLSETLWKRRETQLESARVLLHDMSDEVDLFAPCAVPVGVEMLCWGVPGVAARLRGEIQEVAIDATYETNARHLELYCIMGEHDNAGYPLSYCLLSTAESIAQDKRTLALAAWATCVRDKYQISARFVHTDKDMAEIAMARRVWPDAKHALCLWHLRRAIRTRLASTKLSTTPYDVAAAYSEFPKLIDPQFLPRGKADKAEYEGGIYDEHDVPSDQGQSSQLASTSKPGDSGSMPRVPAHPTTLQATPKGDKENIAPHTNSQPPTSQYPDPLKIRVRIPTASQILGASLAEAAHRSDGSDDSDEGRASSRSFCPKDLRESIVDMMERHYNAHAVIPGPWHPSAEGIRAWAVRQAYTICKDNDLPNLWAYLWGNWYRPSRWQLWARSSCSSIPVLKTTMILESHWRRIKHDFLHHFRLPRCDLLIWILVTKLSPCYYRMLDYRLTDIGRFREQAAWRAKFKSEWRKLERKEVIEENEERLVSDAYRPDPIKWVCGCRAFVRSRFLICKHLVHRVQRVPAIFFLEAKRSRDIPFWKHRDLVPLRSEADEESDGSSDGDGEGAARQRTTGTESPAAGDIDLFEVDEQTDDELDAALDASGLRTYDEECDEIVNTLHAIAAGIAYNKQFRDRRFLETVERKGAGFFRFARDCLAKEKKMQSSRGDGRPSTWQEASSAMFYRPRPRPCDQDT